MKSHEEDGQNRNLKDDVLDRRFGLAPRIYIGDLIYEGARDSIGIWVRYGNPKYECF